MVFFVIGIILLVAEVFLPTFGIVGILGILCIVGGVATTAHDLQSAMVSIFIVLVIVAAAIAISVRVLGKRGFWNRFILRDRLTSEMGFVAQSSKSFLAGRHGTALTPLRPAGAADFDGDRIDVVTSGEFIAKGSRIVVLRVEGTRVVVKQTDV